MKKQTGICIDNAKAMIITLADGKANITEIKSDIENRIYHNKEGDKGTFMGSRHVNNEKKFDERKKNQLDHFLKEVLSRIKDADEIYVFGPGDVKIKLKQKIAKVKTFRPLRDKLKSVETSDTMTKNQLIAKVKKFYNV